MNVYIHGTGMVTSGGSTGTAEFVAAAPEYNADRLLSKEPDYTPFIPAMQLRRMSKAVRMSIAASRMSMQEAGVEKADAISVGTAIGCIQDSEVFIIKMLGQDEQMLTPTAFIQSTHNTVAGQIALLAGCNGPNLTYVQRGHSFEHALINAGLYLEENPGKNIMVGGIDELTDTSFDILMKMGVYKRGSTVTNDVLNSVSDGVIAGEGAAFFIVSDKPAAKCLQVKQMHVFTTKTVSEAQQQADEFGQKCGVPDLVMLGINGDEKYSAFYDHLKNNTFKNSSQAAFKHVCGEYATVSAYALGLLSHFAANNSIPSFFLLNDAPNQLKRFILINNYMHYYSCWEIEAVG
jgi:3-oxoacyl-[acyl-carrier-protein] synthase II